MPLFSRRLPAIVTRADLAWLLAPTYAAALSVDEGEAHDRLERALAHPRLVDDLLWGLSEALHDAQGPRTSEDQMMDRLSKGVHARRRLAKVAPAGPAISAVMVLVNAEIGLASEPVRAMLETEKGEQLLEDGLVELGTHLLADLLR